MVNTLAEGGTVVGSGERVPLWGQLIKCDSSYTMVTVEI